MAVYIAQSRFLEFLLEMIEEGVATYTNNRGILCSGCCRAQDALIPEESANAGFLIGLNGTPDNDGIGKLASFRAKAQLAEEAQK